MLSSNQFWGTLRFRGLLLKPWGSPLMTHLTFLNSVFPSQSASTSISNTCSSSSPALSKHDLTLIPTVAWQLMQNSGSTGFGRRSACLSPARPLGVEVPGKGPHLPSCWNSRPSLLLWPLSDPGRPGDVAQGYSMHRSKWESCVCCGFLPFTLVLVLGHLGGSRAFGGSRERAELDIITLGSGSHLFPNTVNYHWCSGCSHGLASANTAKAHRTNSPGAVDREHPGQSLYCKTNVCWYPLLKVVKQRWRNKLSEYVDNRQFVGISSTSQM